MYNTEPTDYYTGINLKNLKLLIDEGLSRYLDFPSAILSDRLFVPKSSKMAVEWLLLRWATKDYNKE